MWPILAIFAALDMLGGGLQNLLKFWRQHSNVQKSMNVYSPLYPHCIMFYNYNVYPILCHNFEVCKLFKSRCISLVNKWQLGWFNERGSNPKINK